MSDQVDPSPAGAPEPRWGGGTLTQAMARFLEPGVGGVLGIEVDEVSADRVVLRLPVTPRTHQPAGLLHGGVSALLAETAASIGGAVSVPPGKSVVGVEINASHLRGMRDGVLTAVATPVRKGRTMQVWAIQLTDQEDRPICSARCSLMVVDLPAT